MSRGRSLREAALDVVRTLQAAGHVAYWAGGCVRDMLMRRRPTDYDVATDARPEAIARLFRRTRMVGAKFGVVLIGVERHWVETATFRRDAAYADGRRPTSVTFCDAEQDAQRRDFTINGLFYDPLSKKTLDYVGGRRDIKAGVIRAIGDPDQRFEEDHLRLMRAARFAARFDYQVEPKTADAIRTHAHALTRISRERIGDELRRMLEHPNRAVGWRWLATLGLVPHLWPGAGALEPQTALIADRLAALRRDAEVASGLAAVLVALGPAKAGEACRALRTSNETRDHVVWMCRHLAEMETPDRLSLADLKRLMAHAAFDALLDLVAADLRANSKPLTVARRVARRARAIAPQDVAPPPLLTGHDLMQSGLAAGPAFKRVLEAVYYAQLNGDVGSRAKALALAKTLIAQTRPADDHSADRVESH